MTALIVVAALALAAACVLVWGASEKRNLRLAEYVGEEHERNLDVCRQVVLLIETFGHQLKDATLRETEDTRAVLEALISDRRYLVTAIVAANNDPRTVQRLGLVAQADNQSLRPPARDDYMDELRNMAGNASRETETLDGEGNPIIPVGMGG